MAIKLIVGLGNAGKDYQSHRHNAGFWFVDALAEAYSVKFKKSAKFLAEIAQISVGKLTVYLAKPSNYMNLSGQSVRNITNFYQLNAEQILIAHDELDLNPSSVKLKLSGGHGGHNGLKDTIKALNTPDFYRLRIGIGHPGDKTKVINFVLNPPNKSDLLLIQYALNRALTVIELIIKGETEQAMNTLHSQPREEISPAINPDE